MLKRYINQILLSPDPADTATVQEPPKEGAAPGEAGKPAEGEAAEDPPEEASNEPDPFLAVLMADAGVVDIKPAEEADPEEAAAGDQPKEPTKPDAGATPSQGEPKATEPAAPAAPQAPKKPASKRVRLVEEDEEPAATPAPEDRVPEPEPPAKVEFTQEQEEDIREAEVAERLFGDRYKGHADRLRAFYREFDSKVAALQQANPDRTLDNEDREFQALLSTKPKIEPAHSKKVQREIGAEEAGQRVKKEITPKIEDLEMKQRDVEATPKVEASERSLMNFAIDLFEKDEALAEIAKAAKAGKDVVAEMPFEGEIAVREVSRAKSLYGEYLRVGKFRSRKLDLQKNETHAEIVRFINSECDRFKRAGGDMRVQGGRKFLTRQEFFDAKVNKELSNYQGGFKTDSYWTFDHNDVGVLFATRAKIETKNAIKEEAEIAERRGFQRKPRGNSAEQPKPKEDPAPINPPRANPSIAKSGAGSAPIHKDGIDPVAYFPNSRK